MSEVELSLSMEKVVWREFATLPKGSQRDPEPLKTPQIGPNKTQRPYEIASFFPVICCSSMLNPIQFIMQL